MNPGLYTGVLNFILHEFFQAYHTQAAIEGTAASAATTQAERQTHYQHNTHTLATHTHRAV